MLELDLHVHTHHSVDSFTDPRRAVIIAARRNLDGLAFTDHDTFEPDLLRSLRKETDLLLIPGIEVSSNRAHILGYFVEEEVEPWRSAKKIVSDIHDQGGLAVLAHPFRLRRNYPGGYFELFDAIEQFNARSGDPTIKGSPNYHTRRLTEDRDGPVTAGSDSHLPWTIGRGRTIVKSEARPEAVKEALIRGETETVGTPTLNVNRALSQGVRALKDPAFERWLKLLPRSLRWIGMDILWGLKGLLRWIVRQ